MADAKNVLGESLQICSTDPMTGFYRDGCCHTGRSDAGVHVICAVMTDDFLRFSKMKGNDLSTPRPEYQFLGLNAGDHWCLCAARWKEAYDAGMAPDVDLAATHVSALEYASIEELREHQAEE